MNLQSLLNDYIDRECISVLEASRRLGIPKMTLYGLLNIKNLVKPQRKTLRTIAINLGIPFELISQFSTIPNVSVQKRTDKITKSKPRRTSRSYGTLSEADAVEIAPSRRTYPDRNTVK